MVQKKVNFTLPIVAGIMASILVVFSFTEKISTYAKTNYLIPCIDVCIEKKQAFPNAKIEVMYKYNQAVAKMNGTEKIWDACVDEVYNVETGKVSKIQNFK